MTSVPPSWSRSWPMAAEVIVLTISEVTNPTNTHGTVTRMRSAKVFASRKLRSKLGS